jgi:hypothetical protein
MITTWKTKTIYPYITTNTDWEKTMHINPKYSISVWDVYWHINKSRQRKITDLLFGFVEYHDWIWYWYCTIWSFFTKCQKQIIITDYDKNIALKVANWKYKIYDNCKNEIK